MPWDCSAMDDDICFDSRKCSLRKCECPMASDAMDVMVWPFSLRC